MSRIDKLVTNAFPDELRNVEPIEVDEDAVLALTLAKLGLEQPAGPLREPQQMDGEKKLIFFDGSGQKRVAALVEIPLEREKHHWTHWAGGAAAACLALACLFWWGPLLLGALGFGTRAHSTGELGPEPSDGSVNGIAAVQGTPAPTASSEVEWVVLEGNANDIEVRPGFTQDGSGLSVTLRIRNAPPSYYSVRAQYQGKELYCVTRREGDSGEGWQDLELSFLSEVAFDPEGHVDLIVELVPALVYGSGSSSLSYLTAAGFTLHLDDGAAVRFSRDDYLSRGYTISSDYLWLARDEE